MAKNMCKMIFLLLVACLLGVSASSAGLFDDPVPDDTLFPPAVKDYTDEQVDQTVLMEQVGVAPYRSLADYGVDTTTIPDGWDCESVKFMRFRLNDAILGGTPDTAAYADAGLIMVPGVLEGANGFEHIARHLVYQAYVNRGLRIEVWAMDRRGNCIEDITGAQEVENMYHEALLDDEDGDGNPVDPSEEDAMLSIAAGYYYQGMPIDGNTFDGWYTGADLPFLAEFGLQMDTEDMYQIIEAMMPEQADRNAKVFIGGHSLGGLHTSFFAGWDKDGDPATPDDAGFNNTAGLFCFDSIVGPLDNVVNDVVQQFLPLSDYVIGFGEEMTRPVYRAGLAGLRSGIVPRIAEGEFAKLLVGSPIGPEVMTLIEAVGALAYALPDNEHTAVAEFYDYLGDDVKETLQKYVSRNFNQLFWQSPDILDYRLTNEAMLGFFFDDDYTHISMIAASMGFMYNGAVVEKDKIVYTNLMSLMGSSSAIYVPSNAGYDYWWWQWHHVDGPLYKWAGFDEVARPGVPFRSTDGSVTYTTYENEMSDIHSLARALFIGPTNLVEWYFPIRKILDMVAGISEYGRDYGLNCIYPDEVEALPKIEFIGEQGVLGALRPLITESDTIPGMNHMDPMFTSANTSGFKANPVIGPLLDFVAENID